MKKILITVAALALSLPALAQVKADVGVNAGVGAKTGAAGASAGTGVKADVGANAKGNADASANASGGTQARADEDKHGSRGKRHHSRKESAHIGAQSKTEGSATTR